MVRLSRALILPVVLVLMLAIMAASLGSLNFIDQGLQQLVDRLPRGLDDAALAIGVVSNFPVLLPFAAVVAVYEFWRGRVMDGLLMLGSLSSLLAFFVVKETVRRARPVTDYITSHGLHDHSFPSGHVTGATAVFGMAALLLWRRSSSRWARAGSIAIMLFIVIIGVSRVYIGAHYPTDVLGGWLLALVIVSVLSFIKRAVAKRGQTLTGTAEAAL